MGLLDDLKKQADMVKTQQLDQKTLRAVFKSWRMRHEAGAREIRILYLNMRDIAESAEVLAEQDWLTPVARNRRFVVLAPVRAM